VPTTPPQAKRIAISVEVPADLRWKLKMIALDRRVLLKDLLRDILQREAKLHKASSLPN
jgi:hypothetical protein